MLANIQKKQFFAVGSIAIMVTSLSFAIPVCMPDRMDTKNATVPEIINAAVFLTIVLIVAFACLYICSHPGKKEQIQSMFNSIV